MITVQNAGKKFSRSLNRSMLYGAVDILQSIGGFLPDSSRLRQDEFWAVEDVSFELKKGETLGIIGPNGSGKTTFLRMLNGIFMPDKGSIEVTGRVGGLIQVGAGFHPMLSGRENIYINGSILGMTKKEIDEHLESIIDFADIGNFLEAPVKHYSSGMFVRLGFAVAIHCRPDILLIDEILSVGDIKFQSKCSKFITENLLKRGCTIIFISHNRYAVQDLCERALYINRGKMMALGKTDDVMDQYLKDMQVSDKEVPPAGIGDAAENASKIQITKVEFLDKHGNKQHHFQSGEEVTVRLYYSCLAKVISPSIGLTFVHADVRYNVVSNTDYLFNIHSGYDGFHVPSLEGMGFFEVKIDGLYLPIGVYKYMTYIFAENNLNLIHKNEQAGEIEVLWTQRSPKRSLMDLPHTWNIQTTNTA